MSPEGARSYSSGREPRGARLASSVLCLQPSSAPKGRHRPARCELTQAERLSPEVLFITGDPVFAQKLAILVLKRPCAMVRLLIPQINPEWIQLRLAHRKGSVPRLPCKPAGRA